MAFSVQNTEFGYGNNKKRGHIINVKKSKINQFFKISAINVLTSRRSQLKWSEIGNLYAFNRSRLIVWFTNWIGFSWAD